MTTTDTTDISPASADLTAPVARVAPDSHPVELARLARLERLTTTCDPLAAQAFWWLSRACGAATSALGDGLRALGLSTSGFNALLALHDAEDGTLEPWQLAERLGVSRPSVTGLLDTLQTRGFVTRTPHGQDRRRVLVILSRTGREVVEGHLDEHCAHQRDLFADLSADERIALVELLRRVRGAVPSELAGTAPPT